ncbi:MAG TPA: hypothetical protein VN785_11485 [Candidatus Angelobacter sp.]|nr:hypothetical protein [Candidatus Angelobacter sp.]
MQTSNLRRNNADYCLDFLKQQIEERPNFCHADSGWASVMADAYREGRLVIVVHIEGGWLNGKRENISAILNFSAEVTDRLDEVPARMMDIGLRVEFLTKGYLDNPVLVPIVEIPQQGKQGRVRWMSSVVRLYGFDSCPHCLAQGGDSVPLRIEGIPFVADGELKTPLLVNRQGGLLRDGYAVDQMVERRTQVVNEVTEKQTPAIPVRDRVEFDSEPVKTTFRVMVLGQGVRLFFLPSTNFVTDGFGVFLCTAEFQDVTGGIWDGGHGVQVSTKPDWLVNYIIARVLIGTNWRFRFQGDDT